MERDICKAILRHLRSLGAWAIKMHGGPYQRAGLPDIWALCGGKLLTLEVKVPGGKPTELQAKTLDELRGHGAVAEVVTSVDDVKRLLARERLA